MDIKNKKLIVIAGPTAVGKTDIAIRLAECLNTEIISCDSRQFYKELNIGTAKPGKEELARVKHYFIDNLSIQDYYNVSKFEKDVLTLLEKQFQTLDNLIMVGGSGLYIDAVCNGIDDFPDPPDDVRNNLKQKYIKEGLPAIRQMLMHLDPEYYNSVDLNNPNRILRALEVCLTLGDKYSKFRSNAEKKRNFEIVKIALQMPRELLVKRIDIRVDQMMQMGLLEEVKSVYKYKHLNALNTVGYKELFAYLENEMSYEQAVANIKTNTRRYAKRQITWIKRDKAYHSFSVEDFAEISKFCRYPPRHCRKKQKGINVKNVQ